MTVITVQQFIARAQTIMNGSWWFAHDAWGKFRKLLREFREASVRYATVIIIDEDFLHFNIDPETLSDIDIQEIRDAYLDIVEKRFQYDFAAALSEVYGRYQVVNDVDEKAN